VLRKLTPGREKSRAFWQSVIEQDGELMSLKRMKPGV
jgi:hypothetical protein